VQLELIQRQFHASLKLGFARAVNDPSHLSDCIGREMEALGTLPTVQVQKLQQTKLRQCSKIVSLKLQAGGLTVGLLPSNLGQTSTLNGKKLLQISPNHVVRQGQVDTDESIHQLEGECMVKPSTKRPGTRRRVVTVLQADTSRSNLFRQHLLEDVQRADAERLDTASDFPRSQCVPNVAGQRGALTCFLQSSERISPFA